MQRPALQRSSYDEICPRQDVTYNNNEAVYVIKAFQVLERCRRSCSPYRFDATSSEHNLVDAIRDAWFI